MNTKGQPNSRGRTLNKEMEKIINENYSQGVDEMMARKGKLI